MLTWLIKTKQYFTTKVFTADRFRTNDKPTESEYSNLFASIVFKVHDLASFVLAGIVRKATLQDFLLGKDEKLTNLTGYTHNEPLYASPQLVDQTITPAGTIVSWLPFRARHHVSGQRFADNTGNILDNDFIIATGYTTLASLAGHWFDAVVVNYFEKYYLSDRWKICDGRTISFVNPLTGLSEAISLPDLKERVLRQGSNSTNPLQPNQNVFQYGGMDFQNLSHTHTIYEGSLEGNISVNPITFVLGSNNIPAHTHNYDKATPTTTSINTSTSGSPTTLVNGISYTNIPSGAWGGTPDPVTVTTDIDAVGDITTSVENPLDFVEFLPGINFVNVDNRPNYFNTYFIIAIY